MHPVSSNNASTDPIPFITFYSSVDKNPADVLVTRPARLDNTREDKVYKLAEVFVVMGLQPNSRADHQARRLAIAGCCHGRLGRSGSGRSRSRTRSYM